MNCPKHKKVYLRRIDTARDGDGNKIGVLVGCHERNCDYRRVLSAEELEALAVADKKKGYLSSPALDLYAEEQMRAMFDAGGVELPNDAFDAE